MSRQNRDTGASPRLALLVLGMHRSGTSALTRVLALCGAHLPRHLIPPSARNPLGFFESEVVYRLHDELLTEAGTAWWDPTPFPRAWFDSSAAARWVERMQATLADEYGDSAFFVLKDPRLCRLVPFWLRVLDGFGVEARFVLPVRDPIECATSLRDANGLPLAHGLLLWLDHVLAAERDTRERSRAFVTYPQLLADWRGVVRRLEEELELRFPRRSRSAESEIDEFLSRRLRRQVTDPEETLTREDVHPWVKEAYRFTLASAEGRRRSGATLDRVGREFERAEAAFGPALAAGELARRRREEERQALAAELEEARGSLESLRGELSERRRETAQLRETTRMLFRWVVDRVRVEGPAPPPLRAALEALEKAEPAGIPGIASTGLLLSDQRLEIERLERERVQRATELAELATRLGRLEEMLEEREDRVGALGRELEARETEARQLREESARRREEARELRARCARESAEARRLAAECARTLARAEELAGSSRLRPSGDS